MSWATSSSFAVSHGCSSGVRDALLIELVQFGVGPSNPWLGPQSLERGPRQLELVSSVLVGPMAPKVLSVGEPHACPVEGPGFELVAADGVSEPLPGRSRVGGHKGLGAGDEHRQSRGDLRDVELLCRGDVSAGLDESTAAHGGVDELEEDPQGNRRLLGEHAGAPDRGGVAVDGIEVGAARGGEDQDVVGEEAPQAPVLRVGRFEQPFGRSGHDVVVAGQGGQQAVEVGEVQCPEQPLVVVVELPGGPRRGAGLGPIAGGELRHPRQPLGAHHDWHRHFARIRCRDPFERGADPSEPVRVHRRSGDSEHLDWIVDLVDGGDGGVDVVEGRAYGAHRIE